MPTVISDNDEILRTNKHPPYCQVTYTIGQFKELGGKLFVITGAPLSHVPKELFSFAEGIFGEHGAVRWNKGGEIIVSSNNGAIEELKKGLGINVKDGFQQISGGTVIVEGPREASLTLLFGRPSHYPHVETTADPAVILARSRAIIEKENLAINIVQGHDGNYSWLDYVLTSKKLTVESLLKDALPQPVYYLGDRKNDLEVMELPGIIPVGFSNCIPEIISLAKEKGVYMPELAYESGVPLFLRGLIKNGKLS